MRTIKLLMAGVLAASTMLGAGIAFAEEVTVKLWARADRSGPLRAGNIVAAAEPLNAMLKAFLVGQGPDVYVAAHEWVGEFRQVGLRDGPHRLRRSQSVGFRGRDPGALGVDQI